MFPSQGCLRQAKYAADFHFSNMLRVKFLRSPHSHALIRKIDVTEAARYPGVQAVIVGEELPVTFGVLPTSPDETAMAVGKVRYVGEIVAAVAAETEQAAAEAVDLIHVEFQLLRSFLTPEDALAPCSCC